VIRVAWQPRDRKHSPLHHWNAAMTDEMLAEHARQGNGTAFATLVARHCHGVYRIAANLCPSAGDAEEVIRQTLLSAYRDAGSRPGDKSFRVWLYGLAMTKALGRRQAASPSPPASPEVFLPRFDAHGGLEPAGAEWPDPVRLERADVAGFLREALQRMDDEVRAAFVLCDLVELPTEEAAAVMQTSPQVVRWRAHRARLMLRGLLDRLWSV
jgi:RNA polymerase sigma-70 factor, ECF subfamily